MKDDTVYLRHILDAIGQIEEYVGGVDVEVFLGNRLIQDGVIRQFEIMGEATKNLSPRLKESYPHTPWKDIAGMRDKLIHQYFGVDLSAVWETVVHDLPQFRDDVSRILSAIS